jgi:hypothetical protein
VCRPGNTGGRRLLDRNVESVLSAQICRLLNLGGLCKPDVIHKLLG